MTPHSASARTLPAQRIDAAGRAHVDQRAVLALALPLMANSARADRPEPHRHVVHRPYLDAGASRPSGLCSGSCWAVVMVLGGVGSGGPADRRAGLRLAPLLRERRRRCGPLCGRRCAPRRCLLLSGACQRLILAPFGFDPEIQHLATQFWFPRVARLGVRCGVWAAVQFLQRYRPSARHAVITVVTAVATSCSTSCSSSISGWGIAGSGWATTVAQALALLMSLAVFLREPLSRGVPSSQLTWKPHWRPAAEQLRLGFCRSGSCRRRTCWASRSSR